MILTDLDMGFRLNPQPSCGVVLGLGIVAGELDNVADALKRKVEGELADGLNHLPNIIRFGQVRRQRVVDRQTHVPSFV